jgi:hypothetical protein
MADNNKYEAVRAATPLLSALVFVVAMFSVMDSNLSLAKEDIKDIKVNYVGQKELSLTLIPLINDVGYNKKAIEENGEVLERIEKSNSQMLKYLQPNSGYDL